MVRGHVFSFDEEEGFLYLYLCGDSGVTPDSDGPERPTSFLRKRKARAGLELNGAFQVGGPHHRYLYMRRISLTVYYAEELRKPSRLVL